MEVINGLIRNTLDVKRAELIIRALHIAVKNARHTRFDSNVYPKVKEVPQYAEPESDDVETTQNVGTGAIARPASRASVSVTTADPFDDSLPAVAAVPYQPVDPRDPHFLERFEEGGRVLARQAAEHRAAEARAATARAAADQQATVSTGKVHLGTAALGCPGREATVTSATVTAGKVRVGADALVRPGREATVPTEAQRLPHPSRFSKGGNPDAERLPRKPPLGVKSAAKATAAPKERKNAAQRASAG